ncbi:MAG: 50S ribosomal protein L23 [Planctomycetota bacterium]|jgi:large subunit ribosomal protein L23
MESTVIIRRPLVTEKSTWASGELNRYTFEVDRRATKDQIKRAVQDLYGVRVVGVATQNRKGQLRRNKFGHWRARAMKQAVIKVHPDDRIELF